MICIIVVLATLLLLANDKPRGRGYRPHTTSRLGSGRSQPPRGGSAVMRPPTRKEGGSHE